MFRMSITRTALATAVTAVTLGIAAPGASADFTSIPSIYGGTQGDVLYGTPGGEAIFGFGSSDLLFGRAGGDLLYGGTSSDIVVPGPGKDTVYEESDTGRGRIHDDDADTDKLSGGQGEDRIHAANGVKDYVDCGGDEDDEAVVDPIDVVAGCDRVIKLSGEAQDFGNDLVNFELGTNGKDYLTIVGIPEGTDGEDYLAGMGGDDVLNARGGIDSLYGGDGSDTIYGGEGGDFIVDDDNDHDTLDGGTGADTILAANGFADTIDCGESTHPEGYFDQPVEDDDVVFADGIDTVIDCEIVNDGFPNYAFS